ncbi:von Willebrand factor D and EGF domain-containing protein-like [Patiria miniata]|uniref:Uncharacterized protein n=1 Tax=Patiria miniata TaxID=46514 RepID=A0A913ZF96_PATMI|nr:von Willebrand factor D and EGF domain-containing protein-like [Patiria miniata]
MTFPRRASRALQQKQQHRLVTVLVVLGALLNTRVHGQNTCPRTYYVQESTSALQRAICEPPCVHGQLCVSPNVCQCPAGYAGNNCAEPICSPSCRNGGQCVSPNVCECPHGYGGKSCSQGIVSAVYNKAGDQCLRGHVIKTVSGPSRMRCVAACMRNTRCKSVNYYSTEQLCELNGVTADEAGTSDWFHDADCAYYQSSQNPSCE